MQQEPSTLDATTVLVAIDDTDNLASRGTGQLSRLLAQALDELGLGSPLAVTRHQLLVDDRIPYTSHNSSACIALACGRHPDTRAIASTAGEFLEAMSASGSDPGLAVATAASWRTAGARDRVTAFGLQAKRTVLDQAAARVTAREVGVQLTAHGGDGGGVIGAVAAIGLHCSGADGRFLWMPGMRDLGGQVTYRELRGAAPIDAALDPDGQEPASTDMIRLGDWVRPVLRGGRAILLLDSQPDSQAGETAPECPRTWVASGRGVVKAH